MMPSRRAASAPSSPTTMSWMSLATLLLVLRETHAQWGSESGTTSVATGAIKYYDKGTGLPAAHANGNSGIFDGSVATDGNTVNSVQTCANWCLDAGGGNISRANARGFSWNGTPALPDNKVCRCWQADTTNPEQEIAAGDGTPANALLYCYGCEDPTEGPSSQPSSQPSGAPSGQPSSIPSAAPSSQPSGQPSAQPSRQPSSMPSEHPSSQPSSAPSAQPSAQPSEAPSANPSQGCENLRTDCGWGIFNPWTCRCDCPVGICLDNNEQCYHPCAETIHTNPWAGCSPGWDCPWYPDADVGHCASSLHQPNHFEIYRTAKECCDEHYKGSTTCVDESKAPWIYHYDRDTPFPDPNGHDPYAWPIHFPGNGEHRPDKPYVSEGTWGGHSGWGQELGNGPAWYPDLVNKLNCVYNDNYEDWMNDEGFAEEYLFLSRVYNDTDMNERDGGMEDCCEKWYPHLGDNCPDADPFNPVNAEAEDEPWNSDPYSAHNYYFPDFSENSCGFGRDYPAWMGWNRYERYYLFREEDADLCCERFFPGVGNCPFESHLDADKPQQDYYWTSYQENLSNFDKMPIKYNHTYWPDVHGGTCVNGTNFPSWMASDVDYIRKYLFKDLEGCCTEWFTEQNVDECVADVRQPSEHTYWPDIDAGTCVNGTNLPAFVPEFMNSDTEYTEQYLFQTVEACCIAWFTEQNLADCEANVMELEPSTSYYPSIDEGTCIKGGDMPTWMYSEPEYVENYIFFSAEACCVRWFGIENLVDCKADVRDTTTLPSNERFYPDLNGKTCVNGTDYPAWMNDETEYTEQYIFKTLEGCCVKWFGDENLDDCKGDVVQGTYLPIGYNATDVSNYVSRWYPDLDGYECKKDGSMKSWMLEEDYREWYTFTSEEACCHAFGYC